MKLAAWLLFVCVTLVGFGTAVLLNSPVIVKYTGGIILLAGAGLALRAIGIEMRLDGREEPESGVLPENVPATTDDFVRQRINIQALAESRRLSTDKWNLTRLHCWFALAGETIHIFYDPLHVFARIVAAYLGVR